MVLHIGNREVADKDTYVVPYRWLNDKSVHLYIASCKWDKLVVDLSEEIPDNCLKYVRLKCNEVIVNLPDRKLTAGELELLCELYEDKAGTIRKAYMLGRDLKTAFPPDHLEGELKADKILSLFPEKGGHDVVLS